MKKQLLILIYLIILNVFSFLMPWKALAAFFSFSSSVAAPKVQEEFWLEINLDNQREATLGVDAILNFDPQKLVVTGIEEGELYSSYLGKKIDNNQGRIYLSGATSYGQPVSQSGLFGKVGFLTKAPGETKISFEWQRGKTDDTNVVPYEGYEDLLETKPDDFTLTIEKLSFWEKIIAFIKKIILP